MAFGVDPFALSSEFPNQSDRLSIAFFVVQTSILDNYYDRPYLASLYVAIFVHSDLISLSAAVWHSALLAWQWFVINLNTFAIDMANVFAGRLGEVDIISAQRNWTVGVSLAFSGLYVCSVAFLIAAKRSPLLRLGVNKLLEFLIDHPKGPVFAIAAVLAAVLYLVNSVRGKV
jgi:hypothetical protein